MAHKVHPKSYRIKNLADWSSRWLERKDYSKSLEEDFRIRDYLNKKIGKLGVEKIEIERFAKKISIIIFSARPGLLIGRGGGGVEDIKKDLEKNVFKSGKKTELKLDVREVKSPWSSASLAGQWVAQQLEKRMPQRKILKQAIEKVMASKDVQGTRFEVSGRLGGAEIARREWLRKGRLPRQTIRADIDYAQVNAYTTYGVIGIKVWIYKGDKFE